MMSAPMSIGAFYQRLAEFVAKARNDDARSFASGGIAKSAECLALNLEWFGDQLRVIEAMAPHEDVLQGARVLCLGRLALGQLLKRLWSYSFMETRYWLKEDCINSILQGPLLERITFRDWPDSARKG